MQQMRPTYFFDTPSNYNLSSVQPTWYYPGYGASSCRPASSSYTTQLPINRHPSVQHIRYPYNPYTRPYPMDGMQEQLETTSPSNQNDTGTWQHGLIDRKQAFHRSLEILGIASADRRRCHGIGDRALFACLFRYFERVAETLEYQQIDLMWAKISDREQNVYKAGLFNTPRFRECRSATSNILKAIRRDSSTASGDIGRDIESALMRLFNDEQQVTLILGYFETMLSCFISQNRQRYGNQGLVQGSAEVSRIDRVETIDAVGLKALADMLKIRIHVVDVTDRPMMNYNGSTGLESLTMPIISLVCDGNHYHVLYPQWLTVQLDDGLQPADVEPYHLNGWTTAGSSSTQPALPTPIDTYYQQGISQPQFASNNNEFLGFLGEMLPNSYAPQTFTEHNPNQEIDCIIDGRNSLVDLMPGSYNFGHIEPHLAVSTSGPGFHGSMRDGVETLPDAPTLPAEAPYEDRETVQVEEPPNAESSTSSHDRTGTLQIRLTSHHLKYQNHMAQHRDPTSVRPTGAASSRSSAQSNPSHFLQSGGTFQPLEYHPSGTKMAGRAGPSRGEKRKRPLEPESATDD
ncbi:hypothetical protein KVT40_003523 [Elsinoe batatas]|uniref:ubiquitinyl hydrolase 1 n=1 Tax=Elsinoe batatas TaxID=2601811 RepID=A0A8K0L7Q7_9PEZI|nr:hypothetical protein KVT40_003523 [Elsinoe batatas]